MHDKNNEYGNWLESDSWQNADSWQSADGNKKSNQLSLPYIIQIVNSCTSAISNVDILDSFANRTSANCGQSGSAAIDPNPLTWTITVSSGTIEIIDWTTQLVIGVAAFTVDEDTTSALLALSVNTHVQYGTPFTLAWGANTNNYTASYNASTNEFSLIPPIGVGATYNGKQGFYALNGAGGGTGLLTFSGGVNSTINIVPSSTISGVTYSELLAQTEQSPFSIGRTMIVSTSAGQLNQTVQITHRDATGKRKDHVIAPIVDPYQTQTDRIVDDYSFLADGYTRIRFNQINASATVFLYLFPMSSFSATQLVAGRDPKKVYEPPYIVKAGLESLKLRKGVPPNSWNK
jgi:hypothetical protein